MAKCFNCQKDFKRGDAFCSGCGKKLTGKSSTSNFQQGSTLEQVHQAPKYRFPHDDLSRAERKLDEERRTEASFMFGILIFIAVLIAVFGNKDAFVIAIVIGLVSLIGPIYIISKSRTYSEYVKLPGAEIDGKHRCIYCGHKGVYKKGEYASNSVTASCTACEAFLYETTK